MTRSHHQTDNPRDPARDPALDTGWMERAACRDIPGLPWTLDTVDLRRAPDVLVECMQDTCATCPVLNDCAAYVDAAGVCGGWWAGHDRDPNATRHADTQDDAGAAASGQPVLPLPGGWAA